MQGSTPSLYSQSASYEQSSQHPQLSPSTQSGQASQIQNAYSLQYASQLQQPYPYQFQPPTQLQQAYTFPYAPQLQVPLLDPQLQATSQPKKSVKSRNSVKVNQKGRTINFTPKEDEALVKAWIAISGDGIIGNSQSGKSLWSRIYNTFNELLGIQNPEDDLDRSSNSLACRWTTIQHQVNKFCGYFATIDRNPRSGTNFDDHVEDAKKMFRACENSDFKMEELWKILRDNPKWNERNVAPKRKQNLELSSPPNTEYINIDSTPQYTSTIANSSIQHEGDGNPVTPGTHEDGSVRPKFGRKKAKEIKKRGINVDGPSSKPITEFVAKFDASVQQQLAISEKEIRSKEEMHRKDQEMKERHFQEMKERHFHQKDEFLRQQDQLMRQKQWQAEKEILEKDLRQMDCEQAEMFRKIQRDIWAKWQREGTLPL